MKESILTLFLLAMTLNMSAEACSIFKFPVRLAKVAVRAPGSTIKASVDTIRMAGLSLVMRLGGFRDPK